MSWFDRADPRCGGSRGRRALASRALAAALALAGVVAAGGCADGTGFQPVYGSLGSSGTTTTDRLKEVDVVTIPGRIGQRVRNEIQFKFNEGENSVTATHRLETVLTETLTTTLVRSDGLSSSQVYQLTAAFKLIRVSDKQTVFEGKSVGRSAFERNASIYANVRAREDAENRAAKAVGTEMAARVSIFLSRPPA